LINGNQNECPSKKIVKDTTNEKSFDTLYNLIRGCNNLENDFRE